MPTITRDPARRAVAYARRLPVVPESGELTHRIRRFFETPFGALFPPSMMPDFFAQPIGWLPAVEVAENDKEFVVTAELPGMKRDDVTVEHENGVLTIEGMKKEQKEEKKNGDRYHLFERTYGNFRRTFAFPAIDEAGIEAQMKDGVLTVTLPKTAVTKPKGRRVQISEAK